VQTLSQHGKIQINQQDEDGKSALIEATKQGYKEIVEVEFKLFNFLNKSLIQLL
jgi:hypothetical protein